MCRYVLLFKETRDRLDLCYFLIHKFRWEEENDIFIQYEKSLLFGLFQVGILQYY